MLFQKKLINLYASILNNSNSGTPYDIWEASYKLGKYDQPIQIILGVILKHLIL